MLVVVTPGEVLVDGAELHRGEPQPLALQTTDDLADEPALDGIGLAEDESPLAHERRQATSAPSASGQARASGADHVERAGHHDLTVGTPASSSPAPRRRRRRRRPRRVPARRPASTAASATVSGAWARGLGGRQHTTSRAAHRVQGLEHLARILLAEQPDDEGARRSGELLGERADERVRAGDVVRTVEQHQRLVADHLEPSRRAHRLEDLGDDFDRRAGDRGTPRRPSSAIAALSAWCAPCSERNTVGYCAPGVYEGRRAVRRARGGSSVTPKSRSRNHDRAGLARLEDLHAARDRSRRARAVAPGFTIPAFSAAMSARVGPRYSTWSTLTFVTTATCPSTTLVASQVPPETDLDDADVDRDVGEEARARPRSGSRSSSVAPGGAPRARR